MRVQYRFYTNAGQRVTRSCATVEEAYLLMRKARRDVGANFREYSIDDGKTWLQY